MANPGPFSDKTWRQATEARLGRYGATLARHEAALDIEMPQLKEVEGTVYHLYVVLLRIDRRLAQTFEEILGRFERNEARRDEQFFSTDDRLERLKKESNRFSIYCAHDQAIEACLEEAHMRAFFKCQGSLCGRCSE